MEIGINNTKPTLSNPPSSGELEGAFTVGITGGIGSGKSTIAELFKLLGYPVYSADIRSKWLMDNDPDIKAQLIATFGKEVYPGKLDRAALANIIFNDEEALAKVNAIAHPAVEKDFLQWRSEQNTSIVFKEAAILFESGSYKSVDKTICVVAPEVIRVKRVMQRDGVSAKQVQERIANQWTDEKKMALADYVIYADDNQLAIPQALSILEQIKSLLHN